MTCLFLFIIVALLYCPCELFAIAKLVVFRFWTLLLYCKLLQMAYDVKCSGTSDSWKCNAA